MRKIYFLLSLAFLASTAMAQIDVTFAVDMNAQDVSPDGVFVAGDWQSEVNGGEDWQAGDNEMTDVGGGLYTLTVSVPAGGYQFKYINGSSWENVPSVSQIGGNANRYFQARVGTNGIDTVPFEGSAMPGLNAIKVIVDMADEVVDPDAWIFIAGDLITPNWNPNVTPLFKQNDGNAIYIAVIQVADGDYQYKFVNGDDWEAVSDECGDGGNRTVTISGDMEHGPNCFGFCGPCAAPTDVTFRVDMTLSTLDYTTLGVNLMGTATDWGDGAAMSDDDGDNVYELTLGLQPGDYEFKFKVGNDWEGIGNRPLTVVGGEPQLLVAFCFNWPVTCPDDIYDPADVIFNCDVNAEVVPDGQFVWVMGGFTGWQDGALQMSDDDGDGIWEITMTDFEPQIGFYKFAIGNEPNGSEWVEESADFTSIGGCGMDNPGFSDNRFMQRTSNDAMLICFSFNTCDLCLVGIEELESLNRVEIYPNPVVGDINIVFEKSGLYNIRLLDVTGKVILSTEVNAAQTVIGSDDLNAGVYFIQITDNDNNTVTKKIVK
jgi:hypothetical protein